MEILKKEHIILVSLKIGNLSEMSWHIYYVIFC